MAVGCAEFTDWFCTEFSKDTTFYGACTNNVVSWVLFCESKVGFKVVEVSFWTTIAVEFEEIF